MWFFRLFIKKKIFFNEKKHIKVLYHRGPDSHGIYENYKTNNFKIVFNRLSIIDLDQRSNQPYIYKNLVLSFNGEIYNYKHIKNELAKIGCKFETTSDTEVLIKSIFYFGIKKTLILAEGMWSFVLYDKNTEKLTLCRDKFGEKPLYYLKNKKGFFFASEIMAFKFLLNNSLKLNHKYIQKYLFYDYRILNSDENQIFKNLIKISSGTYLTLDKKLNIKKYKYFNNNIQENNVKKLDIIKDVKLILSDAIKNSLNSNRKLAFTLSGGIDSTGLVSIAKKRLNKKVKCFTIFSDDKSYDEFKNVKDTVQLLKLDHSWIKIKKEDTFSNLKKIISFRTLPFPTYTSYIQWLMFKEISKQNFKVIIGGNGSDEIFSGYYDHYLAHLIDLKKHKKNYEKNFKFWKKFINPLIRNPKFKDINYYKKNYLDILKGDDLSKIFSKKKCSFSLLNKKKYKSFLKNRMENELFYESVPVILNEEDLNAMYFSIENRSPYLNSKLYNYIRKINSENYIQNGFNKAILRKCIKGIAPKHVVNNYEKIGFNISLDKFLNLKSKKIREFLLKDSKIFNLVKKREIIKIYSNDNNIEKYSNFLFKLLNIKILIESL